MDDATGAAPTQRCPACTEHKPLPEYTPSQRGKSGAYCRLCRSGKVREWRTGQRVMRALPPAELDRLRAMVACLVCHAIPKDIGGGHVRTEHDISCTAIDPRLRKTG